MKVRVSITLDEEDACFLRQVLEYTGDGGGLWTADFDDDDMYTDKNRRAWLRLNKMLIRACEMHEATN